MADNWEVSPIFPTIAASLAISIPTAGLRISAYLFPSDRRR